MTSDAQAVCDAITLQRKYGHPTCAVDDRTAAADPQRYREILDEFVATLGFTGLGEGWIEISIQAAKTLVRDVLFKDLAYSVAMMSEDEAALLTERFFALFDGSVRCFTNGNLVVRDADPTEVPGAWSPITEATFDAGVVCLGGSRIGILWVEDHCRSAAAAAEPGCSASQFIMTEAESLRIIREVFDGVVIDNIVVEYEAIVDERVAKVYVPIGEIEAALADNGALPRRAAIQSGLAVEVVASEN